MEANGAAQTGAEGVGGWSVFDAVPETWPAPLAVDLDAWRQGHVLKDVPVTWLMPPGADDVTFFDNDSGSIAPAADASLRLTAAIVCSQPCVPYRRKSKNLACLTGENLKILIDLQEKP